MKERLVELTDATAAAAVGRGLSLVLSTDPTRLCAGRRRGGLLRRRASVEKTWKLARKSEGRGNIVEIRGDRARYQASWICRGFLKANVEKSWKLTNVEISWKLNSNRRGNRNFHAIYLLWHCWPKVPQRGVYPESERGEGAPGAKESTAKTKQSFSRNHARGGRIDNNGLESQRS